MSGKQVITTKVVKSNQIQLPAELASHPLLPQAKVEINEDIVTFTLPINPKSPDKIYGEIWQYVHRRKSWTSTVFTK